MGWIAEPGHEGFVVGYVHAADDRDGRGTVLLRELAAPDDRTVRMDLRAVSAGCECGWRSPVRPAQFAQWHPFIVVAPDALGAALCQLWRAHAAADGKGVEP